MPAGAHRLISRDSGFAGQVTANYYGTIVQLLIIVVSILTLPTPVGPPVVAVLALDGAMSSVSR